ncbi:hypothetical protein [Thermoanaerobacterium sp. DL9XJH110]|uniref:hypothetical protein n=1 Tax=Thermoanaerobacterium sp. DL9XJH110 TaxID=3386643 RepID=UPI003BB7826B
MEKIFLKDEKSTTVSVAALVTIGAKTALGLTMAAQRPEFAQVFGYLTCLEQKGIEVRIGDQGENIPAKNIVTPEKFNRPDVKDMAVDAVKILH